MGRIGDKMQDFETFIRVYENALSPKFCHDLVQYFEWCQENNKTWERTESTSLLKNDNSCLMNPRYATEINFSNDNLGDYLREFNISFWDNCYPDYRKHFDALDHFTKHSVFTYKIQKTLPSEGYHVWHCENGSIDSSKRIATYIVYLNDVFEGGETEFLYQRVRVPPKQGSLVIFPASYTHVHRGNPPLKGVKYILTGWIEFG